MKEPDDMHRCKHQSHGRRTVEHLRQLLVDAKKNRLVEDPGGESEEWNGFIKRIEEGLNESFFTPLG